MTDVQVFFENGKYTCNPGLTVQQWKAILQDSTLVNAERLDMLTKFYNEPEHKSTCRTFTKKYDKERAKALIVKLFCPFRVKFVSFLIPTCFRISIFCKAVRLRLWCVDPHSIS